ncbi:MAG TPA: hypothetical protein VN853_19505 [Polyangia bacterium]|jgi:hypothetical protein|nr:hypothetical protein [Polyangia bacterium]
MTNRFIRTIAAGTLLSLGGSSVGCGYLLHPERRGLQSGSIDGATMVMDCLWLLAGIVPGVVALVVDFSSGGIYAYGSRHALRLGPDGRVALQVPHASRAGRVELRLVTASHEIVARRTALVGPGHAAETVELALGAPPPEPVYFEVATEDGKTARTVDAIEMTR